MKIVYLAQSIIPSRFANSIHVMKMCQAFAQNGHTVHLIIPHILDNSSSQTICVEDIYEFYGVEPCFSITYLPWLSIKGRAYIFGLLAALQAKKHRPDLVYSRCINSCYFSSKMGIPVIYESHIPIQNSGRMGIRLFNRLLKQRSFNYLVVITQSLKRWYLENYPCLTDKVIVAADGADLSDSLGNPIRNSFLQPSCSFRVGYVGHLYPGKGMEIISELVALCPDLEFHVVGGLENDIKFWRDQLQAHPNIIFHGYRPHREVHKIMSSMDALISPILKNIKLPGKRSSDIGRWTSPLKIFEYMAAQKAIVASNVEVLQEILEHERNALLCDPDNLEEWKLALYRLKENPSLGDLLSQNAFDNLKNQFSWKIRAQRVLTLMT